MIRSIHNRTRRGASAVEFAIVLPIVIAFLLASVEFGRAIHANHALQEASQAGCRVYAVKNTTQQQADDVIDMCMSEAGIGEGQYQVDYDPDTKALITTHMEPVSVTITVNYDDVGFITGSFLNGRTITGRCIMPADLEIIDDYDPINPIDPGEEPDPDPDPEPDPDPQPDPDIPPPPWWWPDSWDWPVWWYPV